MPAVIATGNIIQLSSIGFAQILMLLLIKQRAAKSALFAAGISNKFHDLRIIELDELLASNLISPYAC